MNNMSGEGSMEGRRSVVVSEYGWKQGNGVEIINDIRRGYNLYKRPRFQRERDIEVVTSDDMIGPGEVASPAHSVSGCILRALAVTSSPECLSYRHPSGSKGRLTKGAQRNQTRSPPPPSTQALTESVSRHRTNPSTSLLSPSPWCESTK